MTRQLKYKVGDRFLFEAVVSEIDVDDTEAPYYLSFGDVSGRWASGEELETLADRLSPKHQVPQVAFEYYEFYKGKLTDFDEWFDDFFDREFRKEFGEDRAEELAKWLYDNDIQTNLERELALATLITYGPEAVEVEKEKIYKVKFMNLMTSDGKEQFLTHDIPKRKVFASRHRMNLKQTFTKGELVSLGFEGVFDNPMFEVEEVE